uniref:Uncharacterized protein n=1 Tax=Cyanothece sp. (strain PCC 7425 / ATCC 29141) TaxID=395961 RepID=B8HV92_CYAP4
MIKIYLERRLVFKDYLDPRLFGGHGFKTDILEYQRKTN